MLGYGAAVDRDKRFVMTLRLTVQGSRNQLFTCATFAPNQHRGLGGRQFTQQLAQVANSPAFTQQLMFRVIMMCKALPSQACHAKRPAQGDLHP